MKNGIAGLYVNSVFNILRNYQTFPKWLHCFFPEVLYKDSNFSKTLPTLVIVCLFDYSYPVGVKWHLIIVWIYFSLMNDNQCSASCYVLVCRSYILVVEMMFRAFAYFLMVFFFYC